MLACTLTTMFGGAGVISFDAFFDRKKVKKETKKDSEQEIEKIPEPANPPPDIKDANFTDVSGSGQ